MADKKYFDNESPNPVDYLYQQLAIAEKRISDLEREVRNVYSVPALPRIDPVSYVLPTATPYEGQRAIDPTDEQHMWYSNGQWRKAGGLAVYEIKVFEDIVPVQTGDTKFDWEIPEDLDLAEIIKVEGFLSTPGGSSTQIQIRHLIGGVPTGSDILTNKITIESGDYNSKDAATQPTITGGTRLVNWGDHLRIDVDAAGSGAMGLGIIVTCTPSPLGSVALQGSQGPPGGVTNWTGQWGSGNSAETITTWTTATSYTVGDTVVSGGSIYIATANHTSGAGTQPGVGGSWPTVWQLVTYTTGETVNNNGVTYVAIVDHTATTASEPGVGANWESFWAVLIESQQFAGLDYVIDGGGYVLDTGFQGPGANVRYNCTIVEATLLADQAGSVVVDIWKDTYGAYPPTNADSITGSTPLTISSGIKTTDTALTGWSTNLLAGDVLRFNIDSVSFISMMTIGLKLQRT